MSQSATLYRITKENFQKIEKLEVKHVNPSELTDGHATFQGSFMGLEFVLSKGLDEGGRELINEIFNPVHYIGAVDANIFGLESDDEEQFWEMANAVGFLAPAKVKKVSALLSTIEESRVAGNFDAEEINANHIYPGSWHNDEGTELAFNKRQILEDFQAVQQFFRSAAENENYVLSYVG